ncbi:tRNA(adenine34) deaminase [Gurleya vavrai]
MIQDHDFLNLAIKEAKIALSIKEFPIGCIIVKNGKIIASGHNLTNKLSNPLAHAEIVALKKLTDYKNFTIYVNVEPCVMCMDILIRLKIKVFYGVSNQIFGAKSILDINYGTKLGCKVSILLMQKFYEMENENAPIEFRKKKEKRNFK